VLAWDERDKSAAVLLEESLIIARKLGDKRAIAESLRQLALAVREQVEHDRAPCIG